MHNSKQTSEELKSFYKQRAELEDEYARKLMALCRKPLGQHESGTLKASLDTMRGEVESMAKAHKSVADQMKTELEEPMAAFAGMMRERRKIVQGGIEKLLKVKVQQTNVLNKSRDKYEQDCLRIKGYLAQGHMVMGQEERKNKAKLEKTQIQMSANEGEYKSAIAALEETTGRWNRDWKAACDKFQDLEEERLDFTKSSLWTFANIASTVCVTDDASCEKVRLSLENCEVEKDIAGFIEFRGTGQEIPEPPRFINFCRDDASDTASNFSEDDNYSVAQFPRTINPAYRTSSPVPSTLDSHNNPDSDLARQMGLGGGDDRGSREHTPRASQQPPQQAADYRRQAQMQSSVQNVPDLKPVPYNENPHEGMTMYCRTDTAPSDRSSNPSPMRPGSSDRSDVSAPTSMSSVEMPMPAKEPETSPAKNVQKKRSGFFSNSPFRRRSKHEKSQSTSATPTANNSGYGSQTASPTKAGNGISARDFAAPAADLEPVDPRASFQLGVGNNVFDVASPDSRRKPGANTSLVNARFDSDDPIAAALAELKGVTGRDKSSAVRSSADRYHGLATPNPAQMLNNRDMGKTPPPGYGIQDGTHIAGMNNVGSGAPVSRLGAPQPAHTAASMKATTRQYVGQNAEMYGNGASRPGSGNANTGMAGAPRSASPLPMRSASPRPGLGQQQQQGDPRHHQRQGSGASMNYDQRRNSGMSQGHSEPLRRSASPNPYGQNAWPANGSQSTQNSPSKSYGQQGGYGQSNGGYGGSRQVSPNEQRMRGASPQPGYGRNEQQMRGSSPQPPFANAQRPNSAGMALQLSNGNGPPRDARGSGALGRPVSYYGGQGGSYAPQAQQQNRERSKSLAGPAQFTRNGTPVMYHGKSTIRDSHGNDLLTEFQLAHCTHTRQPSPRSFLSQRATPSA